VSDLLYDARPIYRAEQIRVSAHADGSVELTLDKETIHLHRFESKAIRMAMLYAERAIRAAKVPTPTLH
jgi:hypothetical protein